MSKSKPNSFYFLLSVLLVCILTSACGAPVPTEATTYIATINNAPDSARVGIVVENFKFVLYIVSFDNEFNASTARRFSGDLEGDGTVTGISPDGVKINGSINYDNFTGIITNLEGKVITFQGKSVPAGGPTGLYEGFGEYNGQPVLVGAIVEQGDLFISGTVQVKDKVEFITPVQTPPFRVNSSKLILTIGDLNQKIDLLLVDTAQ